MDVLDLLKAKDKRTGLRFLNLIPFENLFLLLKGDRTNKNDYILVQGKKSFYLIDDKSVQFYQKDGVTKIKQNEPEDVVEVYEIHKDATRRIQQFIKDYYHFRGRDKGKFDDFLSNVDNLATIKNIIVILRPVIDILPTLLTGVVSVLPGLPAAGVGGIATGLSGLVASGVTYDMILDIVQLIIVILLSQAQLALNFAKLMTKSENIKAIFNMIFDSKPNVNPDRFGLDKLNEWIEKINPKLNLLQTTVVSFENGPDGIEQKMVEWACKNKKDMMELKKSCKLIDETTSMLNAIVAQLIGTFIPDKGLISVGGKFALDIGVSALTNLKLDAFSQLKKIYKLIPDEFINKNAKPILLLPNEVGVLQDTERMEQLFIRCIVMFRELLAKIFFSDFIMKPNKNNKIEKIRLKLLPYVEKVREFIELIDKFLITNMIGFVNLIMIIQSSFWVFTWLLTYCKRDLKC